MKMTANRLMTMLALYRGTFDNELRVGTVASDLVALRAHGLALVIDGPCYTGVIAGHELTAAGRALVEGILGQTSSAPHQPPASAWNEAGHSSTLDPQRFYMVADGRCMRMPSANLSDPTPATTVLKNPPRAVHAGLLAAEAEAIRLATQNEGARFFVLQAVSVHEQAPVPIISSPLAGDFV